MARSREDFFSKNTSILLFFNSKLSPLGMGVRKFIISCLLTPYICFMPSLVKIVTLVFEKTMFAHDARPPLWLGSTKINFVSGTYKLWIRVVLKEIITKQEQFCLTFTTWHENRFGTYILYGLPMYKSWQLSEVWLYYAEIILSTDHNMAPFLKVIGNTETISL